VKFCPECQSVNYASSSVCRKCGHEFVDEKIADLSTEMKSQDEVAVESPQKIEEEKIEKEIAVEKKKERKNDNINYSLLLIYINFLNLDRIFEKYKKPEFKQKVIQNIKTTIKISFGVNAEFINSNTVVFKFKYNPSIKILEKIDQFKAEFTKFNLILENSLDSGLSYKFAFSTIDEVRQDSEVVQLKLGSDKDVIVSKGAYSKLSNELSLIKISPESYKLVFLEQKPVFNNSGDKKYDKALETILTNITDVNSPVQAISVYAPRGAGKTHLLSEAYEKINKIKTDNTIVFNAQCSSLTQISPYGLIQSFFASVLNCPNVLKDEFNLAAFERKVLDKLSFEKINEEALKTLSNIIYPIDKDNFEYILINKEYTYKHLRNIFEAIKQKRNVVFIIDDFDLIDESSYGFLKYLVEDNYFEQNAKMLLSYKNQHSITMYFQTNSLSETNCLNISLRTLNVSESRTFINRVLGDHCEIPDDILSQIAYSAQGNIAYIEQIIQYMFEKGVLYYKDNKVNFNSKFKDMLIPETLEECFKERLEHLKERNELQYKFLNIASLLGDRLDYRTLAGQFSLSEDEFFDIVKALEKKGYLKQRFDDIYYFKNALTWSYCYIKAKEEEIIKKDVQKLLIDLSTKTLSTPLICPILAQIIDNKELAYKLWTLSLRYANYIGDVNIYTMAQKQSLILLESVKLDNFEYTKNNICERLGKLIYDKNPSEAKDYLSNAVAAAQKNADTNRVIDLSGYLVKSAYLTQDYTGVIEVVDNIIKYFEKKDKKDSKFELKLQAALVKTRKLQALLKLGSWEEIASIVNTEINPVLQKHLNFLLRHNWINSSEIFYNWVEANTILAKAYSQQGNPLAFELINDINKVLIKEKDSKFDFLKVNLQYALAMANTAKGYFDESDLILQNIVKEYSYVIDNPELVCEWNTISLINKVLRFDSTTVKEELFEASAFANNSNNEVSKNFLKTLLAYVLFREKSYLKAIEIATEEMQYFSTKKIALGALLAWYISAAATSKTKADTYCIEICEKAVKICENAQNNNIYFKILFQELLASIYFKLNDIENSQMYCDLALQSANANGLSYLQLRLSSLKASILRENLSQQPDVAKFDYAQNILKMYTRTIDFAKQLNLQYYVRKIEKERTSFRAHCQLNRIIEDK